MGKLSLTEILLILVVVVLLFGAKRLPDLARGLGKSMRILKSEAKALKKDSAAAFSEGREGREPAAEQPPARTISSAPGDTAGARPAAESAAQRTQH
jgi:sec-independent protein translocase protein TatA